MGLNHASAKENSSSQETSPALAAVNHVPTSARPKCVWTVQEAAREARESLACVPAAE